MTRRMLSILAGWVLAAISFTAPPASLAADQANVEQGLMKMERDWCNASVRGDAAAIGAILADEFTDVSLTGEVVSKVQVLADVKAETGAICNIDMIQVRVYGDAAVVVGRTTWKSAAGNGQYRYTDIYVRRGGRWSCVASQATDIKR
jgi:ketosteroid isomerase-like protein